MPQQNGKSKQAADGTQEGKPAEVSGREFTLRLLTPEDATVLERVDDDVFDHPVRPEFVREFFSDPRSLIAVALRDGVVVGMATALAYVHPDKPLQLFINEVGVAGACRHRGLGRQLVSLLLERGRAMGCAEAWVATEVDNLPARAVYTALQGREDPARAVVYTYDLGAEGGLPGHVEG